VTATAYVGATLIDGTGSRPLRDAAVVVEGERTSWVGPAASLDQASGLRIVDVSGTHLIPGLLDANVHLVIPEPETLLRYEPGAYDELVVEAAQVALRGGYTTLFDTWGPLEPLKRVRDRIDSGEVVGSRLFVAGNIIGMDGPWSPDCWASYGEMLNPAVVGAINEHWSRGSAPS